MNNKQNDAKKCLDKLRFNSKIQKNDKFKQQKLVISSFSLAMFYVSSNKSDINALDNLIECFDFIMEYFFNVFDVKDELFFKYYSQLISLFINVLSNDKENMKKYIEYAKKIIDYNDIDSKLNGKLSNRVVV